MGRGGEWNMECKKWITSKIKFKNNKISNNVYIQDCENCSIFGGDEKLIIGFGVKDLVVVDAGDVILVMDKDKDQEIKHLLNDINDSPDFGAFI